MQDDRSRDLAERFLDVVEQLNRLFHTGRLDEWAQLDMTLPQIKTLILLESVGPARMGNIALYLGRTLSSTTAVVDRLVVKELVTRRSDPNDRRVVICELTSKGRTAVARFWLIGRERIKLTRDVLTVEELETAVRGMELVRDAEEQVQRSLASTKTRS